MQLFTLLIILLTYAAYNTNTYTTCITYNYLQYNTPIALLNNTNTYTTSNIYKVIRFLTQLTNHALRKSNLLTSSLVSWMFPQVVLCRRQGAASAMDREINNFICLANTLKSSYTTWRPGEGVFHQYGPYRYVPQDRVWFLEVFNP